MSKPKIREIAGVLSLAASLAACQVLPGLQEPAGKAPGGNPSPIGSGSDRSNARPTTNASPNQPGQPDGSVGISSKVLGIPVKTTTKEVRKVGRSQLEILASVQDSRGNPLPKLASAFFRVNLRGCRLSAERIASFGEEGDGVYRLTVDVSGYSQSGEFSVSVLVTDVFEELPVTGVAFPTPTPSPTPTPLARPAVVITRIDYPTGDTSGRAVTVKNLGPVEVNLDEYAVSFEYDSSGLRMQHLRFGSGKKLAAGASYTFKDSSTDLTKDSSLGGSGATTMGLQLTQGSLVIYKGVTAAADFTPANITDYLQYGPAKPYTHATSAVAAKVWDNAMSFAPAATSLGKALTIKVEGAIGSTNWEAK